LCGGGEEGESSRFHHSRGEKGPFFPHEKKRGQPHREGGNPGKRTPMPLFETSGRDLKEERHSLKLRKERGFVSKKEEKGVGDDNLGKSLCPLSRSRKRDHSVEFQEGRNRIMKKGEGKVPLRNLQRRVSFLTTGPREKERKRRILCSVGGGRRSTKGETRGKLGKKIDLFSGAAEREKRGDGKIPSSRKGKDRVTLRGGEEKPQEKEESPEEERDRKGGFY